MKKNVLVIILTSIVFLSSVFLGVATVYRVDAVLVETQIVTQAAEEEAESLQKQLLDAYDKKSYFSVDDKKAKEIVAQFPYFRLVSFKKSSPNRIIVKVAEDEEVYAVAVAGEENRYYILNDSGAVLGERESYANRLDGENNLLIKGLNVTGSQDGKLVGDDTWEYVLSLCKSLSKELGGIRRNVTSVEVLKLTDTIVRITMREGVKIYVGNPNKEAEAKAKAAVETYLGLSDEERITGRIAVSDNNGELVIGYAKKDEFEF